MYKKIVQALFWVIICQSMDSVCQSQNFSIQDSIQESINYIPYGLKPKEWHNLQKMWNRRNYPVRVHLANDSVIYGQILGVNDSSIILWSDVQSFYNPYDVDRHLTIIDSASIRNIFDHYGLYHGWWKRGVFLGTIGGAVIGTAFVVFVGQGWIPFYFVLPPAAMGAGAGYLMSRRKLKMRAIESEVPINYTHFSDTEKNNFFVFPDGFPEAVPFKNDLTQSDSTAILELAFNDILAKSPRAKQLFRSRAFSIAGQYVKSLPAFNYHESNYFLPGFGLSARFNLTNWLNTGYNFRHIHYYSIYIPPSISSFAEHYSLINMSHTLFFQFVPMTPDRFLTRRFEISAGLGASFNKLNFHLEKLGVFNSLADVGGEAYEITLLYDEDIKKLNAGLVLLVDFGYYISKSLSLNLNVENSLIRDLETKQKTVKIPRTGESATFESLKIDPSSISYSLGIRLHF